MIVIKYLIVLVTFSIFLSANHLTDFYKLLDSSPIIKLRVDYKQSQFDNIFESSGNCYLIDYEEYYYESIEIKLYSRGNQLVTKNYKTNQILYNDIDRTQFNILDLLSGRRDQIEFLDKDSDSHKYHFVIPLLGFKGFFDFRRDNGHLENVTLIIGPNQLITIKVISMEILKNKFIPNLEVENFEIIDLRE